MAGEKSDGIGMTLIERLWDSHIGIGMPIHGIGITLLYIYRLYLFCRSYDNDDRLQILHLHLSCCLFVA